MSCVRGVEVEWVIALSYLRRSLGDRAEEDSCLLKLSVRSR